MTASSGRFTGAREERDRRARDEADGFRLMTLSEIEALIARTRQAAERGKFELCKTTDRFDGTYRNPQWLG